MAGRPKKPTQVKRLQGNPGKRPLVDDEPKPEIVAPTMPYGFVGKNPDAAKFWRKHMEALEGLGVVSAADFGAWYLMCLHYQIALDAYELVRRDGLTRRDENNVERKHPALQIFRDNSKLVLQYANQFGLTPSGRASLSVTPGENKKSLIEVLSSLMVEE